MADTTTDNFALVKMEPGSAGWDVKNNENFEKIDGELLSIFAMAQLTVIDKDLTAPPGLPADRDIYIIATGATGAWAGHDGKVAVYSANAAAWAIIAPINGWVAQVTDEGKVYRHTGAAWQIDPEKAALAGDSTQAFAVKPAVTDEQAVPKLQFDAGLLALDDAKADLAGNALQAFAVAPATAPEHVVRKDQYEALSTLLNAGIIKLADDADAQGFTEAAEALTPATLAAAFGGGNQLKTNDGYQLLPGGLILQIGRAQASNAGTVVTLPLTFPLGIYQVITIHNGTGANLAGPMAVSSKTAAQFTALNGGTSSPVLIDYIAIGF